MTIEEKKEVIMKYVRLSEAEFEMMTKADGSNCNRLNKLFEIAQQIADKQLENSYAEIY